MDVFKFAIHGTGYPLPGGYDELLAYLCITTSPLPQERELGTVISHYLQDLDLSGFKNLTGLALLPALNEKLPWHCCNPLFLYE
jgi:hypothetical protein